jgi:vacuolar-type H+-ATPase subunit B/Vma2
MNRERQKDRNAQRKIEMNREIHKLIEKAEMNRKRQKLIEKHRKTEINKER